jgi:hypothetical protein
MAPAVTTSVPLGRDGVCPAPTLTTRVPLSVELECRVAQVLQAIVAMYLIGLC